MSCESHIPDPQGKIRANTSEKKSVVKSRTIVQNFFSCTQSSQEKVEEELRGLKKQIKERERERARKHHRTVHTNNTHRRKSTNQEKTSPRDTSHKTQKSQADPTNSKPNQKPCKAPPLQDRVFHISSFPTKSSSILPSLTAYFPSSPAQNPPRPASSPSCS